MYLPAEANAAEDLKQGPKTTEDNLRSALDLYEALVVHEAQSTAQSG